MASRGLQHFGDHLASMGIELPERLVKGTPVKLFQDPIRSSPVWAAALASSSRSGLSVVGFITLTPFRIHSMPRPGKISPAHSGGYVL